MAVAVGLGVAVEAAVGLSKGARVAVGAKVGVGSSVGVGTGVGTDVAVGNGAEVGDGSGVAVGVGAVFTVGDGAWVLCTARRGVTVAGSAVEALVSDFNGFGATVGAAISLSAGSEQAVRASRSRIVVAKRTLVMLGILEPPYPV